jgi:hypothetical protein
VILTVCVFPNEGTELQGNLGIVPERILCWDDYSHCMSRVGLSYQGSKACEAQDSEGGVSNTEVAITRKKMEKFQ